MLKLNYWPGIVLTNTVQITEYFTIFNLISVGVSCCSLFPDIDECEAIPGLCEGGVCVNSIGSFRCDCPEGQARNPETNSCEDRDECEEDNVCDNGRCVNTDGSYYCSCNQGFIPTQDRKQCIGIGPNHNILSPVYDTLLILAST